MSDKKLFKVVAGSLTRGNKRYGFGDTIELTNAEASGAFYKTRVLEVGARVPVGADAERVAELEARIAELEGQLAAGVPVSADAERIAELEGRIAELEGQLAAGVTVDDAPPPPPKAKK